MFFDLPFSSFMIIFFVFSTAESFFLFNLLFSEAVHLFISAVINRLSDKVFWFKVFAPITHLFLSFEFSQFLGDKLTNILFFSLLGSFSILSLSQSLFLLLFGSLLSLCFLSRVFFPFPFSIGMLVLNLVFNRFKFFSTLLEFVSRTVVVYSKMTSRTLETFDGFLPGG